MQQIQPNVMMPQQQSQQGSEGDPFLGLLGTFLPMAFGLPPMPALGSALGGQSWATQMGGALSPFLGGMGSFGGGNYLGDPFLNRMQGVPNSFNSFG